MSKLVKFNCSGAALYVNPESVVSLSAAPPSPNPEEKEPRSILRVTSGGPFIVAGSPEEVAARLFPQEEASGR